jgi:hypothetical protein
MYKPISCNKCFPIYIKRSFTSFTLSTPWDRSKFEQSQTDPKISHLWSVYALAQKLEWINRIITPINNWKKFQVAKQEISSVVKREPIRETMHLSRWFGLDPRIGLRSFLVSTLGPTRLWIDFGQNRKCERFLNYSIALEHNTEGPEEGSVSRFHSSAKFSLNPISQPFF